MTRRFAAVALVALAAATGCGGDDERDRVEQYIERANTIQREAAGSVAAANDAYAKFANSELSAVRADIDLTTAANDIRATRERLAELQPPSVAQALHRRLLEVYELNAEFAEESTTLARYLPAARAALRPLEGIGRRLRSRLEKAKTPAAQTDALDKYVRGTYGQYAVLRRLDPPPVLVASHRAQLQRLFDTARLAEALRAATRARNSRQVARLLVRFRRANRQARPARLNRDAVRAYNERYRSIDVAVAAMQREQTRLQQRFA